MVYNLDISLVTFFCDEVQQTVDLIRHCVYQWNKNKWEHYTCLAIVDLCFVFAWSFFRLKTCRIVCRTHALSSGSQTHPMYKKHMYHHIVSPTLIRHTHLLISALFAAIRNCSLVISWFPRTRLVMSTRMAKFPWLGFVCLLVTFLWTGLPRNRLMNKIKICFCCTP